MRNPEQIRRLEYEAQREYIRSLYATLPEDPITMENAERYIRIKQDIEDAEKELWGMER